MPVHYELYRVFEAVAQNGSLTGAAKELYVSQSAVSQSIKQVEGMLGGRLFVRTPRGMELTPEGSVVYDFVRRATSLLNEAENKFSQMKKLMTGRIRISASDTLSRHFLLPAISAYHAKYPDVIIQVTNRTSLETADLLRNGKVDIGFVNMPFDMSDITTTKCRALHDCFIGDKRYKDSPPMTYEQIGEMPLLMLETASNTRRHIDRIFLDRGVLLRPILELGSLDLLPEFAAIGLGVACVTREFALAEIEQERVFEIPLVEPLPERGVGLITLAGAPLTFAAERFVKEHVLTGE